MENDLAANVRFARGSGQHCHRQRGRIEGARQARLRVDEPVAEGLVLAGSAEIFAGEGEDALDVVKLEVGPLSQKQGRQTRHVGRRHAGPAQHQVVVGDDASAHLLEQDVARGEQREDLGPGRGDVDEVAAVGVRTDAAVRIARGDHDDVLAARRPAEVRRAAFIPRGDHDDDVLLRRIVERRVDALAFHRGAPADVDDPGALIGGVLDGADSGGIGDPILISGFEGHHAPQPGHAGDADAVVGGGADGAREVGAVADVVGRDILVVDEVPSVHVVDEPVAVVVDAVIGNLVRIGPDLALQVLVRGIHARVDDRGDDVDRAVRDRPRPVGGNGLEPPQIVERLHPRSFGLIIGIIGSVDIMTDVVRFDELDLRLRGKLRQHLGRVDRG